MKNPLKIICFVGLGLALIISWAMLIFALVAGRDFPRDGRFTGAGFDQELRAYDIMNAPRRVMEGDDPALIERQFSLMQRQVNTIDEQLSVLKRRRALAQIDRRYIAVYEEAAHSAAQAFPYSAPIAAVAVDAVLMGADFPLSPMSISLLRNYSSRIAQERFNILDMSLQVLTGDMNTPELAAAMPAHIFSQDFSAMPAQLQRDIAVNDFLLRVLRSDIQGAGNRVNDILAGDLDDAGFERMVSRMAAEFFYDHDNPLRAAELFLTFEGDHELAMAADAFVLAGEVPAARNIWLALSTPRSIYNMAASSSTPDEEISWLERLVAQRGGEDDALWIYSVIRYTRLLDTERGMAILDDEAMLRMSHFDLELLRRRLEGFGQTRATAEAWLLLGRHPADESLHEWAAWYFDHQRLFAETTRVMRNAERAGMGGSWLDLHRSLAHLREGRIAEGERILLNAYNREQRFVEAGTMGLSDRDWRIPANLGHIQESRRSIEAALDYYESAAAILASQRNRPWPFDRPAAAQIQMRISRCMETQGRLNESRRAIENAMELDPFNVNIRREHARFQP